MKVVLLFLCPAVTFGLHEGVDKSFAGAQACSSVLRAYSMQGDVASIGNASAGGGAESGYKAL